MTRGRRFEAGAQGSPFLLPPNQRATFDGHTCGLLQTQPFEGFKIRLEIGIAAGFVLTSPAWLYQIWAFITPGLRRKERKYTIIFVAASTVLNVNISGSGSVYYRGNPPTVNTWISGSGKVTKLN